MAPRRAACHWAAWIRLPTTATENHESLLILLITQVHVPECSHRFDCTGLISLPQMSLQGGSTGHCFESSSRSVQVNDKADRTNGT